MNIFLQIAGMVGLLVGLNAVFFAIILLVAFCFAAREEGIDRIGAAIVLMTIAVGVTGCYAASWGWQHFPAPCS